jgi:hypothetical protein
MSLVLVHAEAAARLDGFILDRVHTGMDRDRKEHEGAENREFREDDTDKSETLSLGFQTLKCTVPPPGRHISKSERPKSFSNHMTQDFRSLRKSSS